MAHYNGIGLDSFNFITASFDVIDVAFDNILLATVLLKLEPPTAPTTLKVIVPAAPTVTRKSVAPAPVTSKKLRPTAPVAAKVDRPAVPTYKRLGVNT